MGEKEKEKKKNWQRVLVVGEVGIFAYEAILLSIIYLFLLKDLIVGVILIICGIILLILGIYLALLKEKPSDTELKKKPSLIVMNVERN